MSVLAQQLCKPDATDSRKWSKQLEMLRNDHKGRVCVNECFWYWFSRAVLDKGRLSR